MVHITGSTRSINYPVTNGSTLYSSNDHYYTKLNSNGDIVFSTFLGTGGSKNPDKLKIVNDEAYILASTGNYLDHLSISKILQNGNIAWSKTLHIGYTELWDFFYINPNYFEVVNNEVYLAGISTSPNYPVTDNSQFYGDATSYKGSCFFTHFDENGNIVFSTFLGAMQNIASLKYANNKFYISGSTDINSYPTTDNSSIHGTIDNVLVIIKSDDSIFFSGYMGGSGDDHPYNVEINNEDIYISGITSSDNYPVTDTLSYKGNTDCFITKVSFCPDKYHLGYDTLSPKIQTVCKYGLAEKIIGRKIIVPGDSLHTIYLNNIPATQNATEATYQWQVTTASGGTWTNIIGATLKDYIPIVAGVHQYYRRLAFTSVNCGASPIHISDTAVVSVNNFTAPIVNGGGSFISCVGVPIKIGGSPTASGGTPPYTSYRWDTGGYTIANPLVAASVNTIYTVIVTDAAGCKQIGQSLLFPYTANAGSDKNNCAGSAVRIGTPPISGLSNVVYNWQPATNLSSTVVAQPYSNPATAINYNLTLTIPMTGGGTCSNTDTLKVTPIPAPATNSFAGHDTVLCLGSTITVGTPAEPGLHYTWSPASTLSNINNSIATYNSGNTNMPVPNPATLTLTAQKNGCSFTDQAVVATIESRAGDNGCGPRLIGMPDRTPGINETYAWTKISGSGNFTGPANLPQVAVSASNGSPTLYGLLVTYLGASCYSEVTVPANCESNCQLTVTVLTKNGCPGFSANGGEVSLSANSTIVNATYTWWPQQGLSAYTGNIVKLTDNISRTYTVTATSIYDTSIHCSGTIKVNDPNVTIPVFNAPNIAACSGIPVSIGLPNVAGYSYVWTGNGLSNDSISNPVSTVDGNTEYLVKVTNSSGCTLIDTVEVTVQNIFANAGEDRMVCSNGIVKLGNELQSGILYSWQPEAAPWQNGTNQFSAQPEILLVTDASFILTATNTTGCVKKDTIHVVINNLPYLADARDEKICFGDSKLIGSSALPGVIYKWTPDTGLNNSNIAQPLANPAITTLYTVTAIFPGSCAFPATEEVMVTVSDPRFHLTDINYCPSNGPVSLGTDAPAGMRYYNWYPSQLVTNAATANPSTLDPAPNITTSFMLYVTNSDGCVAFDTLNIHPAIIAPYAGSDKVVCKNSNTTIGSIANITGSTITYSWNPGTNLDNASGINPIFTGSTGGLFAYTLTKTDNALACSSKDIVLVRVIDSLLPALNGTSVCTNSCVQIGTEPVNGLSYHWSPSTGLSNASIANPIACVGNVSASYLLTASDNNGCSAATSILVGVNNLSAPQINIPDINTCAGNSNSFFNPTITPAESSYTYVWWPNDGSLNNIYSKTPGLIITDAGNRFYTLEVTDTTNGCTNTSIGKLIVNNCNVLASIGNLVWFDNNSNGIQDLGEPGVSGAGIRLYNNTGFNVASTITDPGGFYSFTNIQPGENYYILFNKPTGYSFTLQNTGGTIAGNNNKADATGRSSSFNVAPGDNILNMDAGIKPTGTTPVRLLNFTGTLQNNNTVLLNWQTTAEYNNHYFDVERSTDGLNFISIGKVNGNGTSSLPHSYSLIDAHPVTGINYYRLKQVDFDGHWIFSSIISFQLNNKKSISVFYNQNSHSLEVVFNQQQGSNTKLILYASNGQLIQSVTEQSSRYYVLRLPLLADGIYMLQVQSDKINYTEKIFIRK